jgi:hypothetical protein
LRAALSLFDWLRQESFKSNQIYQISRSPFDYSIDGIVRFETIWVILRAALLLFYWQRQESDKSNQIIQIFM